jgi:hypothetical protein
MRMPQCSNSFMAIVLLQKTPTLVYNEQEL